MLGWYDGRKRAGRMGRGVTGRTGSRTARIALAVGLTLPLSACFRPLYGPTASGEPMQVALAGIQVDEILMAQDQERLGHYVRSELIFALDGAGQPAPKRYRLRMQGSESVQTPVVSSTTARAEAGTIVGTMQYTLESLDGTRVVTEGVATSTATYDRSIQRFAALRAARDAEIRLAKVLADQIKTRIATVLAVKPAT